jgi:hypothetical protein
MVKKKVWVVLGIIIVFALVILAIFYLNPQQKSFTKTSLLKSTIPLGGESFNEVKITNYKDEVLDFNVYLTNMEGLAILSESSFSLEPRDSKVVQISFKDTKEEVNIYLGRLVIEADYLKEEIPIILGTENSNFAFAIIYNSIPKYENVYPAGKLGVEIRVFDLTGESLSTIPGNFYIKNFNNEVIFSDTDTLVVGGSKSKIIDIPQSWEKDDYLFVTLIDYKGTKTTSGYLFTVSEEKDSSLSNNMKLILIIISISFLGILALFFYFVKTRDEFFIQLKKQQAEEMERNINYLRCSREIIQKSREPPKKKEEKLLELNLVKEKVVKRIKKKQEEQIKKLKELKKKKKKPLLKAELNKWKAEGYKMFETEKEVKKITKQSMEKQIKNWKEKGYSTGFLKNKKNL